MIATYNMAFAEVNIVCQYRSENEKNTCMLSLSASAG